MYVNLHDLPVGQSMFTLYICHPGDPLELTEEFDVVAPSTAPPLHYLTSVVIDTAKDLLLDLYGADVQVRGIVNQSEAYIVFDSRVRGYRPIPVTVPPLMIAAFERPYDAFIDLCRDDNEMNTGSEYLDYLTGKEA